MLETSELIVVVNGLQVQNTPGRETKVAGCQWLSVPFEAMSNALRELERSIVLVEPMHHQFQRTTSVEAGGPCIRARKGLRPTGRIVQVGPFGFQKSEVARQSILPC